MHDRLRKTLGFRRERVVLIGSSTTFLHQWRAMGRVYSQDRDVLIPHLWNVGAEPRWRGGENFSLADDAELVKAQLGLDESPVHLIGHGYGGAVALCFARKWPERVATLTVFEPTLFNLLRLPRHGFDHDSFREVYDVAKCATTAAAHVEHRTDVRHVVDYWRGEGTWADFAREDKAAWIAALPKMGLEFKATLWSDETLGELAAITAPTLIMRGADTVIPVRRIAFDLAKVIPSAQLCTIAGAGHMLPFTHVADVLPLVMAHMQSAAPKLRQAA